MTSIIRKLLWAVVIAFAAVLTLGGAAGAWVMYSQQSGNFHVVESGVVYRSNTLGRAQLIQVLKDEKIKSIINLRGGSNSDDWYRYESETAKVLGVVRIDIPLSDSEVPDRALMARLIEALRTAPKPVLIHCKAGADRTGLAAALYEYLIAGKPANVAAEQLSFFTVTFLGIPAGPRQWTRHSGMWFISE